MSLKIYRWPMRLFIAITVIVYGKYTYTGFLEGWSLSAFMATYVSLAVVMVVAMAIFLAFCYVVAYIHYFIATWKKSPNKMTWPFRL